MNLITNIGQDDMSPGEAMQNGSRFYSNTNQFSTPAPQSTTLHGSSQSLGNPSKPNRPNLVKKSSTLSINNSNSATNNTAFGSGTGGTKTAIASSSSSSSLSTTQYLLSAKTNTKNIPPPPPSSTGHFTSSNSNPNLNDWDSTVFVEPISSTNIPNSSTNVDLLGSLEQEFSGLSTPSVTTSYSESNSLFSPLSLLSFLSSLSFSSCLILNSR